MMSILSCIFDTNDRQLRGLQPIVDQVNALEAEFEKLSDDQIRRKMEDFKRKARSLQSSALGEYLDEILPQVYALVREVSKRALQMRHRDVQLMAGIVLHRGQVAEQKTGEGKTLSATLPLSLNALSGRGCHLVTVNDYLARRDAEWNGAIYSVLGLTVGVLNQEKAYLYDPELAQRFRDKPAQGETPEELHLGQGQLLREVPRRLAYEADITYGTNNQFGFDYLRDNMAVSLEQVSQSNPLKQLGSHYYAIVDEIDSILIDESRTPLIISAPATEATDDYYQAAGIVKQLVLGTDYEIDEKRKLATLTDLGIRKVERMLGVDNLYEKDFELVKKIENALRVRGNDPKKDLYVKNREYIVKDGEVVIVDEFTGRLMPGRRFSSGLHQAIEAKEGVPVKQESKTLATISLQNYFRLYTKLAGMSATCATEGEEFSKIYNLEVVVIPTAEPMIRKDYPDLIYKTEAAKFRAIVQEIQTYHQRGQPVLVGTTSIQKNELLGKLLSRKKIAHQLLNAKQHEKEAQIISQAGQKGMVTVATNMAGRGVDIKLGPGVEALGGLHVIGTERHEARRIDSQLRGRSGRWGSPGSSRFFVSLQDDLMRIFGGDQVAKIMTMLKMDENTPLEHPMVSRSRKVENHNFDIRKHLLEYDDVMNKQRQIVYQLRWKLLDPGTSYGEGSFKEWFIAKISPYSPDFRKIWDRREAEAGPVIWEQVVRQISLGIINALWMDHIDTMDDLRQGIGLETYAQKDPLVEYKRQGRELFQKLIDEIFSTIADRLGKINIKQAASPSVVVGSRPLIPQHAPTSLFGGSASGVLARSQSSYSTPSVTKVGRNDPCPCGAKKPDGSPIKYKHCHGKGV